MKGKKIVINFLVFALVLTFTLGWYSPVQAAKSSKYSITLNKSVYTLKKGKKVKLKAVLNQAAKKQTVEWKSSNKKVAVVSANGKVTAKKKGQTKITAQIKGTKVKAVCRIVVGTPVKSVRLNQTNVSLKRGEQYTLAPTVLPKKATTKRVTYISSDSNVAEVSSEGVIRAVSVGTARITATAADGTGKNAVCDVTVTENIIPVTSVTLSAVQIKLTPGESFGLTAKVLPENASNPEISWESSDTRVAIVSGSGNVSALAIGTAVISAETENHVRAVCTVTVEASNAQDPEEPSNPTNPEDPEEPSNPTNPEDPEEPSNPTDPEEPSNPTDPEDPEEPSNPTNPEDPEEPSNPTNPEEPSNPTDPEEPSNPTDPEDPEEPSNPADDEKILVAYFSWSSSETSKRIAENIQAQTGADIFRIEREIPYSTDYNEVAYGDAKTEADNNERPPIKDPLPSVEIAQYDKIILCYPIWWHTAPMTVGTFLESYDWNRTHIYPVSQSASMNREQYEQSVAFIKECAAGAIVDEGIFSKDNNEIRAYIENTVQTSGAGEGNNSGDIVTNSGEIIALSDLEHQSSNAESVVYYTSDITPEAMIKAYEALGSGLSGNKTAVKLSTGEPPASNYLDPDLIADLVHQVNGTIVENNTAYGGRRASTAMHYQVAEDHGFTEIADFVVLDEDGSVSLPVEGGSRLTENLVGAHFKEYDGYLVLSHFKGHAMAGFGGAIKNISIGLGSIEGKCLIHTAGNSHTSPWGGDQDAFTESMAEAGSSVVDALDGNILYVNVMNHLSVDCDCNGNPAKPDMHDIGILASSDPVALDQACVDLVYATKDNSASLIRRMEGQNAYNVLSHGEEIGLGNRTYSLVNIP